MFNAYVGELYRLLDNGCRKLTSNWLNSLCFFHGPDTDDVQDVDCG
jgi:hypothetical protein